MRTPSVQRRRLLQLVSLFALPTSLLAACSTKSVATVSSTTLPLKGWGTGGVASITAAARAANPFLATAVSSCTLTCAATIGPCHTTSPERRDISDGWDGIPMRVMLRVVDAQCKPVPDAIVEIWHTNYTGGYSGKIQRMCNNNPADMEKQFFRGYQRSDAQGVVQFDSCFPGWYRGRVNHIHFRVMTGAYDANDRAAASLVSQFVFPEALNAAIFTNEPLYSKLGLPDTQLANDNVMGGEEDRAAYIFDVQQIDGVMIASKTIVVRSNMDEAVCQVRGASGRGPGGPGGAGDSGGRRGPPPEGFDANRPPPPWGEGPPPADLSR